MVDYQYNIGILGLGMVARSNSLRLKFDKRREQWIKGLLVRHLWYLNLFFFVSCEKRLRIHLISWILRISTWKFDCIELPLIVHLLCCSMSIHQQQLTTKAEGISCFAWNADRSMIAVCPNNNEIHIYGVQSYSETWQKLFTLCEVRNTIDLL